jgi:transposase-like protein
MAKRYPKETKEEVLKKIREGQRVSEVAKAYGINDMTIRTWLERDTESTAAETLEISRLRRENEALLKIIGQLTYRAELSGQKSAPWQSLTRAPWQGSLE